MHEHELLQQAQQFAEQEVAERKKNAKTKDPMDFLEVIQTLLVAQCTNAKIFAFFAKRKVKLNRAATVELLKRLRLENNSPPASNAKPDAPELQRSAQSHNNHSDIN